MFVLIDTHTHLNFKVFKSRVETVLERAFESGVEQVVCVGTHLKSSRLAVKQAEKFGPANGRAQVWATVGVHPHHVWDYLSQANNQISVTRQSPQEMLDLILADVRQELTFLAQNPRVVGIGEVGFDRHFYDQTQYQNKAITDQYMKWQRAFFITQLEIAGQTDKAVIIHNRESVDDLLGVLADRPDLIQTGKMVFHCCEPETRLLEFAKAYQLYIGVDGDVTYDLVKQEFIKQVPLEMLVLETDSPFMVPEPDRSEFKELKTSLPYKDRVCQPRHVAQIAEQVAKIQGVSDQKVFEVTSSNADRLLGLSVNLEN